MKMKIITILFIIVTLNSCTYSTQLSSDKDLTEMINSQFLSKKKPIDLTKITKFDWNNYIIIDCYETVKIVGEKNNLDLSNIYENSIESSDSFLLLVFLKNRKSIKICEINRDILLTNDKLLTIK